MRKVDLWVLHSLLLQCPFETWVDQGSQTSQYESTLYMDCPDPRLLAFLLEAKGLQLTKTPSTYAIIWQEFFAHFVFRILNSK